MLILTRRVHQKVLFPGLGITVEVLGVGRRTIRLGVDAPREIRVLRDELTDLPEQLRQLEQPESRDCVDWTCDDDHASGEWNRLLAGDEAGPEVSDESDCEVVDETSEAMARKLSEVELAIRLAQNQLQQGRFDYAEQALGHALSCLESRESESVAPHEGSLLVRQSPGEFRVVGRSAAGGEPCRVETKRTSGVEFFAAWSGKRAETAAYSAG